MTEADQSSQNCHYSWIAKAKSRGIQTIVLGRSGHPIKGGHIGGWLSVCSFGVTETPVGGFANGPKGIPVLRTDAAPDVEALCKVLLDPRRLVVTAQRGVDRLESRLGYESSQECDS